MLNLGYDVILDGNEQLDFEPEHFGDVHVIIGRQRVTPEERAELLHTIAAFCDRKGWENDRYHIVNELLPQSYTTFTPKPQEEPA